MHSVYGPKQILKYLLQNGADVNIQDYQVFF